ncbi:uncharacterized protein [Diadema setosum]|uniref:uncharacterized protein n=1 Tax=Diadema setosum TaxID=31175 RepID=UPI003B3B9275
MSLVQRLTTSTSSSSDFGSSEALKTSTFGDVDEESTLGHKSSGAVQQLLNMDRLFADDCMLYRRINSEADAKHLQEDLDALQEWESDWLMEFNPLKCQVLTITNKRKPVQWSDNIHGQILAKADTAKYLGIHLKNNMNWTPHIKAVTKKASSISAFLQRNIRPCPRKTKMLCYLALVRPILEYASTVWDLHTQENIQRLEMVQRRYARFVVGDYHRTSSLTMMLHQLQWPSLQERRAQLKMMVMYRILNRLTDIPHTNLLPVTTSNRGHSQQLQVPFARTLLYQKSFFPDSIRLWNSLPEALIKCTSTDSFRQEVQKLQLR